MNNARWTALGMLTLLACSSLPVHARCVDDAATSDFSGTWVLVERGNYVDLTIGLDRSQPPGHIGRIGSYATRGARSVSGFVYGRCFQDELQFTLHLPSEQPTRLDQRQFQLQLIGDKQMAGSVDWGEGLQGAYAYRNPGWSDVAAAGISLQRSSLQGRWLVWGGRDGGLPRELGLPNPGGNLADWQRPLDIALDGSRISTAIGGGSVHYSPDEAGKTIRINLGAQNDFLLLHRHERRPGLMTGFRYVGTPRNAADYVAHKEPVMMFKDRGTVIRPDNAPNVRATTEPDQSASMRNAMRLAEKFNSACFQSFEAYRKSGSAGTNSKADVARLCRGAEDSDHPVRCFKQLMSGEVSWATNQYRWGTGNAIDLCEGTTNAFETLGCFSQSRAAGNDWKQGIRDCSVNGYAGD